MPSKPIKVIGVDPRKRLREVEDSLLQAVNSINESVNILMGRDDEYQTPEELIDLMHNAKILKVRADMLSEAVK